MSAWRDPPDVAIPEALRAAIGGHPLVAATLVRRGIADVAAAHAFLDPDHYQPAPPSEMPDLDEAAERLTHAIERGERICVWGDFDVDGQTATTILVATLRELGANARYHIPIRAEESHGVSIPVLERFIADGLDLLLTCDTGVTAHEAVAHARARGVEVVVTDHHDLPPALPEAHAVVNPKLLPEGHPLRELPGVGCAYKLGEALYAQAGRAGGVEQHLDLVALGIVADVATLTGDTRYLLQRGLEALRRTQRLGLREVMALAELNPDRLTEEHIGFELAPRLNALGRLADANPAVELLTTDDLLRARTLAVELEGLNARRKLQCDQVFEAAQAQIARDIARDPALLEQGVLVLSHPAWPAGVVGIVAGRLAERYHRPTILLAAPEGEPARGSARSVEGCNITAAIAAHGDLLRAFGGHPMAAGLSIDAERIPEFRHALSRTILETCEVAEEPALQIDGYLALSDLSLDLVEQIERLAPFGPGNPPLTLASRGLSLSSSRPIGRSGEHLQLIVQDGENTVQKVIWWRGAGEPLPEGRFDLAYTVRASDYRGQRDVQVEWVEARQLEAPAPVLRAARPEIEVVDYRQEPHPRRQLAQLRETTRAQVWSEAEARASVGGRDRRELERSDALIIWTRPPGPSELRAALERVAPQQVYLFGIDPGMDQPEAFLARLAGLAKHILSAEGGRVNLATLAAATAQREATVRAGLAWLAARGHLSTREEADGLLYLTAGEGQAGADLPRATAVVWALLEETTAYRAYFARAGKDVLMM